MGFAITPLKLQPEELELLEQREHVSMEVWAEQKYILPETAPIPGPWNNYYTPYLVKPMQKLCAVGQCQVTALACSQGAKTELANILIGYRADQAPAPLLVVMPREDDAHRRVNTRIRPMFRKCPDLLKLLAGGRPESLNAGSETILKNNMIIYLAWSGSPAALSDNSVCVIILDEVGKYPPKSGREADPVSLAKKRVRAFKGRWKILVVSTPVYEDDLIDTEYKKSDKETWWVGCPHCNKWGLLSFWNVVIDKDKEGNFFEPDVYSDGTHSRYVCPECGALWSEEDRWMAASSGMWCPDGCTVVDGKIEGKVPVTDHYGFRINFLMLAPMFSTVADGVMEWVSACKEKKTGNKEPLQDFYNSQLGEALREIQKKTDEKIILLHRGLYKTGFVPDYVQIITNAIDVHLDHFIVLSAGWGYLYQSAVIFYARLETGDTKLLENWGPVEEFLKMTFSLSNNLGEKLSPILTAVDCGFNKETVINFCGKTTWANIIPVRGSDSVHAGIYRKNDKDDAPITRFDLNVNEIKNSLHEILHRAETPGPGYMQIPIDADYNLVKQLCSEHRIVEKTGKYKRPSWVPKNESHSENHYWDALVYAKFAADLVGARMLRDPAEIVAKKTSRFEKSSDSNKQIRTRY